MIARAAKARKAKSDAKSPKKAQGARTAKRRTQEDAPVLLVISAKVRPRVALSRASVFAQRARVPLFVAVCVPDEQQVNMLFPHGYASEATRQLNRESALWRRVFRWCNKNLAEPLPENAVLMVKGRLTACAVSVAAQLKAQLIVFSELEGLSGREVTEMVEDTEVSVMLSRTVKPKNAVVAATDMTLRGFPVVRKGAVVAEKLGAPLTVVHNLEPQVSPPAMIAADGTAFLPVMPAAERAKVRTRHATRLKALGSKLASVETKILQETDTVNAVLGLAKSQQADLVIVGHRRRSWLGRVLGESVAKSVINRSVRSVLVVPIGK